MQSGYPTINIGCYPLVHNNERNIMEYATKELERIADALEEILRLVKKDMAEMKKAAK
jgi:hypothetical protein